MELQCSIALMCGLACTAVPNVMMLQVVKRSLQLGTALGVGLGGLLSLAEGPLLRLFSSDAEVATAAAFLFPAVILTQPLNSLAFVWDGILLGVGGFRCAYKSSITLRPQQPTSLVFLILFFLQQVAATWQP